MKGREGKGEERRDDRRREDREAVLLLGMSEM